MVVESKGTIVDTSVPGEINVKMEGSYKCPRNTLAFSTEVFGNNERAKLQMTSELNGQAYNMVMERTRNSLFVDTNIYKHIYINASVGFQSSLI